MSKNEAKYQLPNMITEEDIQQLRSEKGSLETQTRLINQQYQYQIDEAKKAKDENKVKKLNMERTNKILDMTRFFKEDEYVKSFIMKERTKEMEQYYENLKLGLPYLLDYKEVFAYHLKDVNTGMEYSNIRNKNDINSEHMLHMVEWSGTLQPSGPPHFEITPIKLKGYIGVKKSAPETSNLIYNYHQFNQEKQIFYFYVITGFISLVGSLLFLYKRRFFEASLVIWKRYLPIDLNALIIVGMGLTAFYYMDTYNFLSIYFEKNLKGLLGTFMITTFMIGMIVMMVKLLYRRLRESEAIQEEWRKSFLNKSYNVINDAFLIRSIGTQIMILLGSLIVIISVTVLSFIQRPTPFILLGICFILVGLGAVYLLLKRIGYLNQIMVSTKEMTAGNLEVTIPVDEGYSPLSSFAADINTLKSGVITSRNEQLKSERLKTELITNVSHDLRTPLTSLIAYTELLKKPNLDEGERNSYIDVIDRKSKKLKVLIEDLFEVSKMVSGNMELNKAQVDLSQLLEQALAEHEEQIMDTHLIFRVSKPDVPLTTYVDGQKLWRVFDNLIENILKYALEGTRVFIALKEENGRAMISFKNVTKYELSENIEELFERFKRGDTSRHTDGSGLGLAIAKSIVDLHEGMMEIEVDGDLFKVTIKL
ncbi:MFS domain-containing histidine kinase [Bacillus sp. 31A1R]|uniref:histidine kinase n=2 Tax=Robertmurraya mangrovi TaxID=3098077 RepID=A0ABU5IYL9_9BACI|nr:MFS domain-containing histidine kinase [Bacillus sp. 31A1R]